MVLVDFFCWFCIVVFDIVVSIHVLLSAELIIGKNEFEQVELRPHVAGLKLKMKK